MASEPPRAWRASLDVSAVRGASGLAVAGVNVTARPMPTARAVRRVLMPHDAMRTTTISRANSGGLTQIRARPRTGRRARQPSELLEQGVGGGVGIRLPGHDGG